MGRMWQAVQERRRWIQAAVVIFVVVTMSRCTWFAEMAGMGPQKPKVEVSSIAISGFSMDSVDLSVGFDVENPNGFELTLLRLSYELEVLGSRIAYGDKKESFSVPGNGKGSVTLPVHVDLKTASEFARRMLEGNENLVAILKGVAVFDTPVGGIEMPFHQEKPLLEKH